VARDASNDRPIFSRTGAGAEILSYFISVNHHCQCSNFLGKRRKEGRRKERMIESERKKRGVGEG